MTQPAKTSPAEELAQVDKLISEARKRMRDLATEINHAEGMVSEAEAARIAAHRRGDIPGMKAADDRLLAARREKERLAGALYGEKSWMACQQRRRAAILHHRGGGAHG